MIDWPSTNHGFCHRTDDVATLKALKGEQVGWQHAAYSCLLAFA
jgi:hypothetical protein